MAFMLIKQALEYVISAYASTIAAYKKWGQEEAVGTDHLLPTACEEYLQSTAQEGATMGTIQPWAKFGAPAVIIQCAIVSFLDYCDV